jgi:hypothetical protein
MCPLTTKTGFFQLWSLIILICRWQIAAQNRSDLSKTSDREILEHGYKLKQIILVRRHKKGFTEELGLM